MSEAHLAARRRQILGAARRCFARDGFHRATMHDVVREAGLSAGAVYRYYRSKEELIAALARKRHRRERALLAAASEQADLGASLAALARSFLAPLADPGEREERRLGVQLWAEALRDPKLRRVVRAGVEAPKRHLTELLRRAKRRGELPADLDVEAAARVVIAAFHGLVLQQAWEPGLDLGRIAAHLPALGLARPAAGRPTAPRC